MSRDGRGSPGRLVLKNQPQLTLANVLRRRRTTLKALVDDLGFSTYAALEIWCGRMGIAPVSQAEFDALFPPRRVNSPMEGVVVLEPPPVLDEISGRPIDPEAPVLEPIVEVVTEATRSPLRSALVSISGPPEAAQKKPRQKKESQPPSGE